MSFKLFSGSSNTSLSNSIAKNLGISLSKIDLKHFKEITTGKTIIMGRKTFDSLRKSVT